MDKAKIIHYWHIAGIAASALSVLAADLTPVVSTWPKVSAAVAAISAISLATTSLINKLAQDKVIAAIINDPASPTPQGLGIPVPDPNSVPLKVDGGQVVAAGTVKDTIEIALAKNVAEHTDAVVSSLK